jgi:DNA-binding IclR family transcriptional regulator
MPKAAKTQYLVPAIKRCFDLIDLLAERDKGLTVSEIHRALHLPLSSTAAILYTLQTLGCIEKDQESSRYTLGIKIFSYSERRTEQLDIAGRCHGLLEQLVLESGLTGHIAVMRDGESMYIDRVPSPGLIQFSSYVGMRWPLHVTSVGKVLLAFLPKEELTQTLKHLPLSKMTRYTITVREQLEKQLRHFRRQGYALEISEGELGVACVAAPIFGEGGVALAAVSVTGTTYQISEDRMPSLGLMVKKFANAMSVRLGSKSPE